MIYAGSGDLPKHLYCWVDRSFIKKDGKGFEPCVWFAIQSAPARAWGCHVLLECGAVYRGLPPHALAFSSSPAHWTLQDAQVWDCYGVQFSTLEYSFLSGLPIETLKGRHSGRYLFTAVPLNDGYTNSPSQAKEFMFCELDNGRVVILPTNMLIFKDKSFCENEWPTDLKVSDTVWRSE